ncbi:MAG: hypothetical protein NDI61_08750 [Bdellovibrionaceae bacterium]|nr:hypothetical protein [Pseudobdellovibrionaceae bacterium]
MQRELNPSLFGAKSASEKSSTSTGPMDPAFPSQTSMGLRVPGPVAPEFKVLEAAIHQLKLQLQASEKRHDVLVAQLHELARTTAGRFERVSQALARMENSAAQQIQELNSKYSGIASKVNERKVQDAKVQEMIDRHNNIVRGFENRLTHMQRLISEQELQLHNAQSALEDARHELQKIRRP